MKKVQCILFILSLALVSPAISGEISGKVIKVINGDTIKILIQKTEFTVRLAGVDCPDVNLSFGMAARKFTSRLIDERTVTVRTQGMDPQGRAIGEVILPDGRNLSQELIRSGRCAAQYPNDN